MIGICFNVGRILGEDGLNSDATTLASFGEVDLSGVPLLKP